MAVTAPNDSWREKYFDSLGRLEDEQRRYQAMESALKRVAGRLCTASLGQSTRLDEQVRKLQAALRRDSSSEELDKITAALTDAIQALDGAASAGSTAAASVSVSTPVISPPVSTTRTAVDDSVRAILAAFLGELRSDPELIAPVDALDAKLNAEIPHEALPDILSSLTQLVGQRIKRIEQARQEVEALLGHMVGKLDEIGRFVADQNRSQRESQASSETLNVQLAGEMKAMGESVESAGDLSQLRVQVRSRIESIDRRLQEFRDREAALAAAMHERSDQMRSRILELEAEAARLQSELKDEQRMSTIDALTAIPNRLAYDKRIEEELQRWRRFKQPTCIAACDIDHFKRINDTYGHRAGDRVLRAVADCLSGRIRTTDFLARYGGEEFVLILSGAQLEDAVRVVEELRVAISKIGFHFRGSPVSVTASIGVTALVPDDSAGSAFDRADKALYRAKQSGRNRSLSMER